MARLGAWFAQVDAPTIRLAGAAPQPLAFEDLLATVWEYIPPAAPLDIDDLARALREFHALPPPDFGLEQWDPVGIARKRIADAHALEDTDRKVLLDWCDRLEPQVAALVNASAHTVVHGDAHVGNLLRRPDRRVVFCDFDSTCLGPPGVDLSAVAAAEIWFARDGRHARLAAAYGQDITGDPSWPLLRQVREMAFIVGGVPLIGTTPGIEEQFRLRLDSVMTGDTSVRWTPYAAFGRTDR